MKASRVSRKRTKPTPSGRGNKPVAKKRPSKAIEDEEIPSDMESDLEETPQQEIDLDAEIETNEDPKERKLKLAKKFLAEIQELEKERSERQQLDPQVAPEDEDGEIADGGKTGINRFFRAVASFYVQPDESTFLYLKNGHRLPLTCVAVSPDSSFVISGGKDGRLVKWDVKTQRKVKVIHEKKKSDTNSDHVGHTSTVTSVTISHDGKFVASGETAVGPIKIWDGESMQLLEQLEGHRSGITGLVFRRGSHNLYSCSHDRSVKSWNIDEMSYIETLYGHQEPITAIDSLFRERAVTAGGRDSSLRMWKIPEESQLVFQASPGSCVDAVKFLDNQHFVSGADDGSLSLWGLMKKKPLASVKPAHSCNQEVPNWICSVGALFNTDLFASGSCDGKVSLWKAGDGFKKIDHLFSIPVNGFINALEFSATGDLLAIAVGQEHRMGRWWKRKDTRNQIILVPLNPRQ